MRWDELLILALSPALGGPVIERARSSAYLQGKRSMTQSTLEVVLTLSLMSVLVVGFGAAILQSADTPNFMGAVSVVGLLLVGLAIAVLLLALSRRDGPDIAKRRLLIKAGLVLCGLMIIVTPLSLFEYWALSIYPVYSGWTDFGLVGARMTWFNCLVLAAFATLGGVIIQRAMSRQYEAGS